MDQQAIASCKEEIDNEYSNAQVTDGELRLISSYGDNKEWEYTGNMTGTDRITKENVSAPFSCTAFYFGDSKEYVAIAIVNAD